MPCGVHASESRKPEARLIQRFHLLWQVHRPPHTAKRGLSPAACLAAFSRLRWPRLPNPAALTPTRPQAGCQCVERTRHEWNLRGLYRQRPHHGRGRRGRVRLLARQPEAPRRGDRRAGRGAGRAASRKTPSGTRRPRRRRRCSRPRRRAHEMLVEAERQARERRQQLSAARADADAPRGEADRAPAAPSSSATRSCAPRSRRSASARRPRRRPPPGTSASWPTSSANCSASRA